VYFLGCSFGPFKSENYYNSYTDLFKMSDDVCFRDSYSYELFKGHSNIRMAPDILCSYSINKIEKTNNSIGYSIINPNHKFGLAKHFEEYINYISNNIVKNLQDGLDVSLLSFCEKEADMIAIETILKRIPVKMRQQISIVNYSGDIKSVISIISKLEYFVAGRFHAV
jgi:colanic acid/amylovoran biosynthesis protein